MAVATSPRSRSDIVNRLRTAGCVFAEDEAELLIGAASTTGELAAMVDRRVTGLPLEHILGWVEFSGLRIMVDRGVFVPRRRTEFLVRLATDLAVQATGPAVQATDTARQVTSAGPGGGAAGRSGARPPIVVDLCCGSGAVGAVLCAALDRVELHAVEIDPDAVRCARRNLTDPAARVYQGDLVGPLPARLRGNVDILVANAPYVPSAAVDLMPPEARLHEPRLALDGGADGLDVLRRVIAVAPAWLSAGGHLLVESSQRQAPSLVDAITASGLIPQVRTAAEFGATVVIGARVMTRVPEMSTER